ncbi:MAG TPA: AMP-binding protein [Terriglobia bacterium]|nr:AMP-binding protein [Terriglobia bacterium]
MSVLTEISGTPADAAVTGRWIFDRIHDWAKQGPQRAAFVLDHADRLEEYTYADVLRSMDRIAAGLEARGIRRGDRVGILMENVPHWVFALLGILRMGGVAVPLAPALSESALQRLCTHAECRLVFADAQNLEKARTVKVDVVPLPSGEFEKDAPISAFQAPKDDETALIIYTSGTTGDPKGVEITLFNLAHEIRGVAESFELTQHHRILSVLPFSHVLPLVANGLGPLCIGAAVVFLSSISPQRIVESFHKHRITFFVCVPQFFYVLHKKIFSQVEAQPFVLRKIFGALMAIAGWISKPRLRRKLFGRIHKTVGPDLTILASGGSRFDPAVAQDLDRLGYSMLQAYGLTETAAAATATPASANVIGSVGRPIRGVSVKIDAPDKEGVGEICISGPILMKGYYRDERATKAAIVDGWYHSGDLGRLGPEGSLFITGRSKDVIILANGKNVYPEELEAHYGQSPWIKEICVMGLSEPEGERLHAVVVPDMEEFRKRGQSSISESVQFDLESLSKQLPSYYRILSFSIRHEPLPRTVTRKLQRFEIQRQENERKSSSVRREAAAEHPRFKEGPGAVVAQLIRQAKPDTGPLDVSMNLELDLGFDSLARVELLGLAESQLGVRIDEEKAARIYTLGELIDELAGASPESGRGRNWNEILNVPPDNALHQHDAMDPSFFVLWSSYLLIKVAKLLFRLFLPLRYSGIEKLPQAPFMLCPNHQSFLDGPLLISVLPKRVIDRIFILGYTDYFKGRVMGFAAKMSRIVAVDADANLVQALQVGAAGLRKGKVLLVFPEGTRTIDGQLGEFKKGSAILAYELGVPVVPVGLKGAFEMWPRGGSFRRHAVEVIYGEPIDPKRFSGAPDPYAALTEEMKSAVKKLIG